MAKCQKYEWFAIMQNGDIAKDEDGLALMAKTKKALVDAFYYDDAVLKGKTFVKVELSKITEI